MCGVLVHFGQSTFGKHFRCQIQLWFHPCVCWSFRQIGPFSIHFVSISGSIDSRKPFSFFLLISKKEIRQLPWWWIKPLRVESGTNLKLMRGNRRIDGDQNGRWIWGKKRAMCGPHWIHYYSNFVFDIFFFPKNSKGSPSYYIIYSYIPNMYRIAKWTRFIGSVKMWIHIRSLKGAHTSLMMKGCGYTVPQKYFRKEILNHNGAAPPYIHSKRRKNPIFYNQFLSLWCIFIHNARSGYWWIFFSSKNWFLID